jgi:hypothetical protein
MLYELMRSFNEFIDLVPATIITIIICLSLVQWRPPGFLTQKIIELLAVILWWTGTENV